MESIACVGGTNPLTSFRGPVQSSSLMLVSRVDAAVTKKQCDRGNNRKKRQENRTLRYYQNVF